ncbi:hypothetical protein [Streptomyces violaceusniger]|uniref:Uncharacterized protein n=1 Tax=Streptomyces violaceusniger TaxID=68280 RepID=A0A4D4KLP3_STRVO|nr:hypothetical protein SVIO_001050 [Streptomyces violaceusniger]
MSRILWVNPLCTDAYDKALAESFSDAVGPETSVDVVSFDRPGPEQADIEWFIPALASSRVISVTH